MSYKDVVLASRPAQYYTLDAVDGHLDLSGLGNDMTALTEFFSPIVPGFESSTWSAGFPNPLNILSTDRVDQEFSVELWTNPALKLGDRLYFGNNANYTGLSWRKDRFVFAVTGADGIEYSCEFPVGDPDQPCHVIVTKLKGSLAIIVNGVVGRPVILPDNFEYSGSLTGFTYDDPGWISHFAVYNRALKLDEILSHYQAGTRTWDYPEVCVSDGADFYEMSTNYVAKAFDEHINNWDAGVKQNTVVDRDGFLSLPKHNDIIIYDDGDVIPPSYGTGVDLGGTVYAVKNDLVGSLSNTGGVLVFYTESAVAPSPKKIMFTIFNKNMNKSWCWSMNASSILRLTVEQRYSDGTSTTATYDYDDAVPSGPNPFVFNFEQGRISANFAGSTTAASQVSGQDYIYESVVIDRSTELIFGADVDYVGPSFDYIYDMYLWNVNPTLPVVDYFDYVSMDGAAAYYSFDGILNAQSKGTWEYTFSIPFTGPYYNHAINWTGGRPNNFDIEIDYDGSGFASFTGDRDFSIPNFPITGDLGNTEVNGPFTIRATLQSEELGQLPRIEDIHVRVFADENYRDYGSDDKFITHNHGAAFAANYKDPSTTRNQAPCSFIIDDRLEFPSKEYKTIEFTFNQHGSDGEVLCARSVVGDPEINIAIDTGTLTWTGFDSVYLDGASFVSGGAVDLGRNYHVVAIKTAGFTHSINFGSHYNDTLTPTALGLYTVATYDRVLTAVEIDEHYNASRGLIKAESDSVDSLAILEHAGPLIYSYAWQMTGAPK